MNVLVVPEPVTAAQATATGACTTIAAPQRLPAAAVVMPILLSMSAVHLINDMIQALLPAMYPLFRQSMALSFTQIGVLAFVFQTAASLLQPMVGAFTDRHPMPYSLPLAMVFSAVGIVMLSQAASFPMLMVAAAMVGVGSSIFHPEASRVARLTAAGRPGFAQAVFQVGGHGGTAVGPLLAAFIVVPRGQASAAWFCVFAAAGAVILVRTARWYGMRLQEQAGRPRVEHAGSGLSRGRVIMAVAVLLVLIFSKYFYMSSLMTYYTFYLIDRFGVTIQTAQIDLFVFMAAVATGTLVGGPIGDRIGRKYVIWGSILGTLPFSLALPYMNLFWTVALTIPIGLILASAFSAILVYAQELMPNRIGAVAGLFYGFAFGIAGIGAAVLGRVADHVGIEQVYAICSFLPAIGILAVLLPNLERVRAGRSAHAV